MDQITGIQIGASQEAIEAARGAILAIIDSGQEQKTIRAALAAFSRICEVKGAMVSNCTFTMTGERIEPEEETA